MSISTSSTSELPRGVSSTSGCDASESSRGSSTESSTAGLVASQQPPQRPAALVDFVVHALEDERVAFAHFLEQRHAAFLTSLRSQTSQADAISPSPCTASSSSSSCCAVDTCSPPKRTKFNLESVCPPEEDAAQGACSQEAEPDTSKTTTLSAEVFEAPTSDTLAAVLGRQYSECSSESESVLSLFSSESSSSEDCSPRLTSGKPPMPKSAAATMGFASEAVGDLRAVARDHVTAPSFPDKALTLGPASNAHPAAASSHSSLASECDLPVRIPLQNRNRNRYHAAASSTEDSLPSIASCQTLGGRKKSKLRTKAVDEEEDQEHGWYDRAKHCVHSVRFELFFAVLIFLNALTMVVELQCRGWDAGHKLGYPGVEHSGDSSFCSGEEVVFEYLGYAFGILFTLEVIVKLFVDRGAFFWSVWNVYDLVIILAWLWQVSGHAAANIVPAMLFRLFRVARLMRLLRIVRAFPVFDLLTLLVRAVPACAPAILWSAALLILVMMSTGLFVSYSVDGGYANENIELEKRLKLYEYFGTFTRSFVSVHEVTFGNWAPIARLLTEELGEAWNAFFLLYRFFIGFGLLLVVRGVILTETMKCAQSDDEVMIMQRSRQMREHSARMEKFFHEADTSEDGYVTIDEFKEVLSDGRVHAWLSAQDIDIKDAELVFHLVAQGPDARLSAPELMCGLSRLKGSAKSMDMFAMGYVLNRVDRRLQQLHQKLNADGDMPQRARAHGSFTLGSWL
eukprot:TRINITY_DN20118_c0_g1_i3.p1 TRINITY_DN20118_c0_g1~~TRINITY_DN20118_c0_g1_i3.p1  ORF type:complete len:739 (-),score=98.43 TRINITY_DN20118_c0_g1_i3:453-2669(-)